MSCQRYQKDIQKLTPKLKNKLKDLLKHQISISPEAGKALVGDLKGYYSVRLNFQDRIVYRIEHDKCFVIVIRAKTHYGD